MNAEDLQVTVNDEPFLANCGDLLLDWALTSGIDLPHDCRAGVCGACRVRLVEGRVFGGQEPGDDMIHACQARIVSDYAIVTEAVPDQVTMSGQVIDIVRLAPDVIGVDVELPKPLPIFPVSSVRCSTEVSRRDLTARPIPGRCANDRLMHFHIRRFPTELSPRAGPKNPHRAPREGNGSVWQRISTANHSGSIVLVASGTGFAPMWSIAVAAILERRSGNSYSWSRRESFSRYTCTGALCRLALFSNVTINSDRIGTAERIPRHSQRTPTDHLPSLSPDDVVYTSGAPAMTDTVARIARAAGQMLY